MGAELGEERNSRKAAATVSGTSWTREAPPVGGQPGGCRIWAGLVKNETDFRARVLQDALKDKDSSADLKQIANDIVEDHARRKAPVPGIGHPLHKPIDPRTPVLFGIAEKNGFRGRYVALLEAIAATAEKRFNRTLPINATCGPTGPM